MAHAWRARGPPAAYAGRRAAAAAHAARAPPSQRLFLPDWRPPAPAPGNQVMQSLWALLRPQPGGKTLALAAMSLLGKLGGRSRRWLQQPATLEYRKDPEHGLRWGRPSPMIFAWSRGRSAALLAGRRLAGVRLRSSGGGLDPPVHMRPRVAG